MVATAKISNNGTLSLRLLPHERELLVSIIYLPEPLAEKLRGVPEGPQELAFTRPELDSLAHIIAIEANRTPNRRRAQRLDKVYSRVVYLLEADR